MIPRGVAPSYSPYEVQSRAQRASTNLVGPAPPTRRTTGAQLFKPNPLPARRTLRPTDDQTMQFVNGCFTDATPDPQTQLRTIQIEEISSPHIEPPQTETFAVPPEPSWDPAHRCFGTGEEPTFHPTIKKASYVDVGRWQTHPALQTPDMVAKLKAIGAMKIYTFGHMILANWVRRLGLHGDSIRDVVEFLHRVLQTFDFDVEIPTLIAQFQPRMTEANTTDEWPSHTNFKCAADRWVACCQHAYRYVFDHLTGPLVWNPNWLQSQHAPDALRREVRDQMVGLASLAFDELRHLVYRQYGYLHIDAVLTSKTIEWQRLDAVSERETTRNGSRFNTSTIVFCEKPVHDLFSARLRNSVLMVTVPDGPRTAILRFIVNNFLGHEVRRVVFWMGHDFIVGNQRADYDKLIIDLCHVCSTYFSAVMQHVV